MRLATVESTDNLCLQPVGLRRVFRFNHSLRQPAQFIGSKRAVPARLSGKFNYPVLFSFRQAFYFFDDFDRCHGVTIGANDVAFK